MTDPKLPQVVENELENGDLSPEGRKIGCFELEVPRRSCKGSGQRISPLDERIGLQAGAGAHLPEVPQVSTDGRGYRWKCQV